MGKSAKRMKKAQMRDISSDDDDIIPHQPQNDKHANGDEDDSDSEEYDSEMEMMNLENDDEEEEDVSGNEDSDTMEDDDDDNESDDEDEDDDDDDDMDMKTEANNHADMKEHEKEYNEILQQEQDILRNIRRDETEDIQKGEAIKKQLDLWDVTLEFRLLVQKPFLNANLLPLEPIRSDFCDSSEGVKEAYSDLIDSTKKTLDSILKLQEALIETNPQIMESAEAKNSKSVDASRNSNEADEEWLKISKIQSRIASFRDMSVDKWQRKTQVTSGAAGMKNKFQAFNQNISEQVAFYMRDPNRMLKGMQQRRSAVEVFGNVSESTLDKDEVTNADGDPELLDDSEFYQQLIKECIESKSHASDTLRLQTKKRKIVDRRASKSRKIRYHIHEKIVNFMAPEPMNIPPMASKLFENLFGLKTHKLAQVS